MPRRDFVSLLCTLDVFSPSEIFETILLAVKSFRGKMKSVVKGDPKGMEEIST